MCATAALVPSAALAAPPAACFTQTPANAQTGQTVTFDSTCSTDPDGDIGSRGWDLDNDGSFDDASGTTATMRWTKAGTYTVRLAVVDSKREYDTETKTVSVAANRPPVASFTYSPSAPVTGQVVTFTSTSTDDPDGNVVAQAWDLDGDSVDDFNDGTGKTAARTFTTPGTYTVKLQATDDSGAKHVASQTVKVAANRPPVASFTYAPNPATEGDTVTLTSTATDPDGRVDAQGWDLDGDGDYDDATGPTATFVPARAGSYAVGLRVVDDAKAAATATQTIQAGSRPVAQAAAPASPQTFDLAAPIVTTPSDGEPTAAAVPLRFLDPFPVVRLRGRTTSRGVKLNLVTVRGPDGARVLVKCKGRGCPAKVYRAKIAAARGRTSATKRLRRYERFLPSGTELQIAVTARNVVGKYTRVRVRRVALPVRVDRCLLPGSGRPAVCPRAP